MPLSPLPNFSQKVPYWGCECPQRWGSWKATYRKKGLHGGRGANAEVGRGEPHSSGRTPPSALPSPSH